MSSNQNNITTSGNGSADNAGQETISKTDVITPTPTVGGITTETGITSTIVDDHFDKEKVATFVDSTTRVERGVNSSTDETFEQSNFVDSDLASFFERPVFLNTFEWNTSTSLSISAFDPWKYWLSHDSIKRKLANYQLIRMNLHVRFVINSSPFLYGRAIMTYVPFGGTFGAFTGTAGSLSDDQHKMIMTQAPKVFIDPTSEGSGELCLPFFIPDNYLNIQSYDSDYANIGTIEFLELSPLGTASSSAPDKVDISIYVWATEVELRVPTSYVAQAGAPKPIKRKKKSQKISFANTDIEVSDEYEQKGFLSKTSASVASVAGALKQVPFLEPYAKATEIGANALGGIFSYFGFSRPAVIDPPVVYKPTALASLANTTGGDTVSKLTFDPKQETTIDSSVTGLDNFDHMTFANICSRECWIGQGSWSSADSPGFDIYWADVTPTYAITSVFGQKNSLALSPLAFATMPFKWWSGTLVYRIQVVASAYHKGRLRISYEPNGAGSDINNVNTTYNHIVDLEDAQDYEFSISWCQARPYQRLEDVRTEYGGTGLQAPYNLARNNGRFYISVVNALSSPLSTADVTVNVYVRAGPDFEFMGTKASSDYLTPYDLTVSDQDFPVVGFAAVKDEKNDIKAQGPDDENLSREVQTVSLAGDPDVDLMNKKSFVFHGEKFTSLRSILKRYDPLEYLTSNSVNVNNSNVKVLVWRRPMYPSAGGVNSRGNYSDSGTVYNPYRTPLVTYFGSAFAGYRGGMRYKYIPFGNGLTPSMVEISRWTTILPAPLSRTNLQNGPIGGSYGLNALGLMDDMDGFLGKYGNHSQTVSGHEVELPYYANKRFQYRPFATGSDVNDNTPEMNIRGKSTMIPLYNITNGAGGFKTYVATAEDFNLIWFVHSPIYVCDPLT